MPKPRKKELPLRGAIGIRDHEVFEFIDQVCSTPHFVTQALNNESITNQFLDNFRIWVGGSQLNELKSLDKFPFACFSFGTTQSFDMFYLEHNKRRFRAFKGEYLYHQLSWRNNFPNWCFIEDADLDSNDAVVLSYPFSDNGGKHPAMDGLLEECNRLKIPLLMDCTYFGTCHQMSIDFDHPCIEVITFALSKSFALGHARLGIRLTRIDNDDPMFVYQKINYANRIGQMVGNAVIQNFGPDFIYKKYHRLQNKFCQEMNLKASDTVLFGLGGEDYNHYNRGGQQNRVCLTTLYEKKMGESK